MIALTSNNYPRVSQSRDIEYFDGPILIEHIAGDVLYLSKYGGISHTGKEIFLMVRSTTQEVLDYQDKKISMRTLLKIDSTQETAWLVEYSKRGEFASIQEGKMQDVPEKYFPSHEAFYDETLSLKD